MTLIAQATTALLALFDQECPREQFPYAQFLTYQAEDFTSPMEEGLSLYLFKVDITADPRQGRTAGDPARGSTVTVVVQPLYASFRARLEGAGA